MHGVVTVCSSSIFLAGLMILYPPGSDISLALTISFKFPFFLCLMSPRGLCNLYSLLLFNFPLHPTHFEATFAVFSLVEFQKVQKAIVCVCVCVCVCESLLKLLVLVNFYFHLGIRNSFSQLYCVASSL